MNKLINWLSAPFSRKELEKHDEIIQNIYVAKKLSSERTNKYKQFPLAGQVGNPRLRRRENYETTD